jgi:hypothetical protein
VLVLPAVCGKIKITEQSAQKRKLKKLEDGRAQKLSVLVAFIDRYRNGFYGNQVFIAIL